MNKTLIDDLVDDVTEITHRMTAKGNDPEVIRMVIHQYTAFLFQKELEYQDRMDELQEIYSTPRAKTTEVAE